MARVEQDDLLLPSSAPSSTITLDRQFTVRRRHVGVATSIHAPHQFWQSGFVTTEEQAPWPNVPNPPSALLVNMAGVGS